MAILDLTYGIETEWYWAFPSKELVDTLYVISKELELKPSFLNEPSFRLETIRGITPFSRPQPYAMLELQLGPKKLTEAQLEPVTKRWPNANIYSHSFRRGVLGLRLISDLESTDIKEDQLDLIQVQQLPLQHWRYRKKILMDQAQLVIKSLKEGVLMVKAFGVFEISGSLPQLPVRLGFDSREMIQFINLKIEDSNTFVHSDIFKVVKEHWEDLPLDIESLGESDPKKLAQVLTTYMLSRFAEIQPPKISDTDAQFSWKEEGVEGHVSLNLRHTHMVQQQVYLHFDMLEEIKRIKEEHGFETLVTSTVVQPISTGFQRIEIDHPFFSIPHGIRQMGVRISAPPNLPWRPQALHQTLIFTEGSQRVTTTLKLSPKESLSYQLEPFLILDEQGATQKITGDPILVETESLQLDTSHFPCWFQTIHCSEHVFNRGRLQVNVLNNNTTVLEGIDLGEMQPIAMLAYRMQPEDQIALRITLQQKQASAPSILTLHTSIDHRIRLSDFPAYGFHKVRISMSFENKKSPVALDLIPTSLSLEEEQVSTLVFTPQRKEQEWEWFSDQVDQAGFLFRFRESETTEWSPPQAHDIGQLQL